MIGLTVHGSARSICLLRESEDQQRAEDEGRPFLVAGGITLGLSAVGVISGVALLASGATRRKRARRTGFRSRVEVNKPY